MGEEQVPTEQKLAESSEIAEQEPVLTDLTAFTTTFYREDSSSLLRQGLALNMLENARKLGVKVVVMDGGSNPSFIKRVELLENVTLITDSTLGIGESRREALRAALDSPDAPGNDDHFYLWLEPEKEGLMQADSLTKLLQPLRTRQADIVVPGRVSTGTMPRFQAWIESRANERAMKTLGDSEPIDEVWDFWFGPKIFNKEGATYFLNYKGELDKWDSIIKPVANAFKDGKRVVPVAIDFEYTKVQRAQEEDDPSFKRKRIEQYIGILAEMGDSLWHQKVKQSKERNL